jgi:ribosomal protein RSM22 (predicted rRNA methylase)
MRVPVEFEKAVRDAARAVLGDGPLATGPLVRAIVDRSQRYTSDRDRLAQPRDADGDLAARAAFFTIADAMKIALPLAELASRDALPAARPIRIVDVGAGCGAMSLGAIAALAPAIALEITAIDRDVRALEIAGKAVRGFAGGRPITFAAKPGDAVRAPLPRADLVVMGTVLNELAPDAALGLVERAMTALADDGALIIIEPALRDTSRALHAIRDAMLSRGTHVFAPCTRRCVPCTALVDPSDWCHEDRALELPPVTAELARLTHLRDSGMKFSYLVLRKQALDLAAAGPNAWRVVSAQFVAKGKRELIGCSERGRVPLRLLKRHRTEANRDFERADRGDVLVIDAAPDDKRLEVTDEMAVERIDRLPR